MTTRSVSNVLAVFAAAALVGAMTLIWLVLGRYWQSLLPAAFLDWFAANGPMVGHVMFSFAGAVALGLLASLWLDRSDRGTRMWWIGALSCLAVVLVAKVVREVPLNTALEMHGVAVGQAGASIDDWLRWHIARVVFGALSAVLAIVALMQPRHP